MLFIPDLLERYGLNSRKTLYRRLNGIGLTLSKDTEGRTMATADQVKTLDDLDAHIKQGGTYKSFVPTYDVKPIHDTESVSVTPLREAERTHGLDHESVAQLLSILDRMTERLVHNQTEYDPLAPHRILSEAAKERYWLSTQEVSQIIGVTPHGSPGEGYQWGCWVFTRVGKLGKSLAWLVSRRS